MNTAYTQLMPRNVTVQLDDETIRNAKLVAARLDTSLSKLLAREIQRLAKQVTYEDAMRHAIAQMEKGFHLGGPPYPSRESLHER